MYPASGAATMSTKTVGTGLIRHGLYSSVVERQSCKLKVLGSIPGGSCLLRCHGASCAGFTALCMYSTEQGKLPLCRTLPSSFSFPFPITYSNAGCQACSDQVRCPVQRCCCTVTMAGLLQGFPGSCDQGRSEVLLIVWFQMYQHGHFGRAA